MVRKKLPIYGMMEVLKYDANPRKLISLQAHIVVSPGSGQICICSEHPGDGDEPLIRFFGEGTQLRCHDEGSRDAQQPAELSYNGDI